MYHKKKSPSRACKGFKLMDFFVDFTFFEATKNSLLVDVEDADIVSRRFNTVLKAMFELNANQEEGLRKIAAPAIARETIKCA